MTVGSHVNGPGHRTGRTPTGHDRRTTAGYASPLSRWDRDEEYALTALLLVGAGLLAGLAGSIAGLASLFSYPALLLAGLSPTAANVTNTVALTFSTAGSVAASRPELRGQARPIAGLLAVTVAGGVAGGGLLLVSPEGTFERIVPFLIAAASGVLIAQPKIRAAAARRKVSRVALQPGMFLVAVYGGYFGAAAGVLMLALLLVTTELDILRGNAYKNLLLGVANAVAAVAFTVFGPVDWSAVLPLAAGLVTGAFAGPVIARRLPGDALRIGIGVAGLGLAVALAVDAYALG